MARRKSLVVTPPDDPTEDLPELSPKDQIFVEAVLAGETYKNAWRKAHPNSKASSHTISVHASRLAHEPRIQDALAAARRIGLQSGARTLEGYVADLQRIQQLSIDDKQYTAATRAAELTGRATGHLKDSQGGFDVGKSLEPGELVASVRLKLGDEAARRMAVRLGLLEDAEPAPATMIDVTPGKESQKR